MSVSQHQLSGRWEERWHPLREEWVVIAAHRQNRPWIGDTVENNLTPMPDYVPDCYLCPGNQRVTGLANPDYQQTFVFDNDHPCVGVEAPTESALQKPPAPYHIRSAQGYARVICFSPCHNQTLAELPIAAISEVVQVWQEQSYDLGQRPEVQHVLCFENKGAVVGVSNPHPHGQIYATNFVFKTIEQELTASQRYLTEHKKGLFEAIISAEQADGRRILYEDEQVIAFVPYFARYAYEVYVAPKRRVPYIYALNEAEAHSLAQALKAVTLRFDNLWQISFPYVLNLHQAPTDGAEYAAFHFFIAFHPPLRRANLLKYLAGPELGGGNFISDTAPELKAAELLAVSSTTHYRELRNKR